MIVCKMFKSNNQRNGYKALSPSMSCESGESEQTRRHRSSASLSSDITSTSPPGAGARSYDRSSSTSSTSSGGTFRKANKTKDSSGQGRIASKNTKDGKVASTNSIAGALINSTTSTAMAVTPDAQISIEAGLPFRQESHPGPPCMTSNSEQCNDRTSSRMVKPEIEKWINLLNDHKFQLLKRVGPEKASNIYKKHVEKFHFLVLGCDEDQEMASLIKNVIENGPNRMIVKGRWNVRRGANRLETWQNLIQSATTVLVLMSRAFCKDEIIKITFPETLIDDRAVVPLFLEEFTEDDVERIIPPILKPVVYSYGTTLYNKNHESTICYINHLIHSFSHTRHYKQQLRVIQDLLKSQDADYICPCGRC